MSEKEYVDEWDEMESVSEEGEIDESENEGVWGVKNVKGSK